MVKHNSQEFFSQVGENITKIRKELGVTQEDLAVNIGIKQQSIASYETGRRRIPLPILIRVAETLHVTIEELFPIASPSLKPKRGPIPKIQKQWEKLRALPEEKQKIISDLIDTWAQEK